MGAFQCEQKSFERIALSSFPCKAPLYINRVDLSFASLIRYQDRTVQASTRQYCDAVHTDAQEATLVARCLRIFLADDDHAALIDRVRFAIEAAEDADHTNTGVRQK